MHNTVLPYPRNLFENPEDQDEFQSYRTPTVPLLSERLRERRRLIYCPPTIRDILGGTRPVSEVCAWLLLIRSTHSQRTHCRVVTQPGLCAIHTFFAVTITSVGTLISH